MNACTSIPPTLTLHGQACVLRCLQPSDRTALLGFFASHSRETIFSRYGYYFPRMTPERAGKLVGVDQDWDAALGIFEPGEPNLLHAVGRFFREGSGQAEIALVVREDKRRQGLATALLYYLAVIAAERGIDTFRAQVMHHNATMRCFLSHFSGRLEVIEGYSALNYLVSVGSILKKAKPREADT